MKNSTLLVLLMAAVTFMGCKKNDEDKQKKNILGKWMVKQEVEKEIENGKVISEDTDTDFDADDYMEFNNNGKGITSYDGRTNDFTYQITENNRLIVTDNHNEVEDFEIKKLNSNELIIYGEDEDGPNAIETYEITLRK